MSFFLSLYNTLLIAVGMLIMMRQTECQNPYSTQMILDQRNISCIKYIEGYEVLAIAYMDTGIDLYDLTNSTVQFLDSMYTQTAVKEMFTMNYNSELVLIEQYKITSVDIGQINKTFEAVLLEPIQSAIPWGTQILVQISTKYTNYVCSKDFLNFRLNCYPSSFFFSYMPTTFLKPHPFDDSYSAFAFKSNSNHVSLIVSSSFNPWYFYVPSIISDMIFYGGGKKFLFFTNTKSVYPAQYVGWVTYGSCFGFDFNPTVIKESTTNLNQDVFWYISDTNTVRGRDLSNFNLAYDLPIIDAIELESMQINQDVIVRTKDNLVYVIRTLTYDPLRTISEVKGVCPDTVPVTITPTITPIITPTIIGTNTTTITPTIIQTNTTTIIDTNTTNTTTATNSTDSLNTTNSTTTPTNTNTTNTTIITNITNNNSSTPQNSTPIPISPMNYDNTQNIDPIFYDEIPIFYCGQNCRRCLDQSTCEQCKSGFQFSEEDGTCQAQASITLFSTIISAPYSGIVLNLVLMDFLDEFWFFQHHDFNYTKNLYRIFSLVGSLNRNKIVPPLYKIFARDLISSVNLRRLSASNYLPYTRLTHQRAENTDAYFMATVSGMFIWGYSLILFLFTLCFLANKILSQHFQIHTLQKFACKGALLYQMFASFVQYVSFYAFCQMRVFFAFNSIDKVNLIVTVLFLGMMLMFVFSGFPMFFYFNHTKKAVKEFYGENESFCPYIISMALGGIKFLILGFINGFISNYNIQCGCLIALYTSEIFFLRKSMENTTDAPDNTNSLSIFFKLVMKLLSLFFISTSLMINTKLLQNTLTVELLQTNQEIFIVGIWTWAIADLMFKIIENMVVGVSKLKAQISEWLETNKESQVLTLKPAARISSFLKSKTTTVQKLSNQLPDESPTSHNSHILPPDYQSRGLAPGLTTHKLDQKSKIKRVKLHKYKLVKRKAGGSQSEKQRGVEDGEGGDDLEKVDSFVGEGRAM